MKNGRAWGTKRHYWMPAQQTTPSYVDFIGPLSVEDLYNWTVYVRLDDANCTTNWTIEVNEIPDAPAADWMAVAGFPRPIPAGEQDIHHCIGCYHKRIRVRIQAPTASTGGIINGAFLGTHNWVELKE